MARRWPWYLGGALLLLLIAAVITANVLYRTPPPAVRDRLQADRCARNLGRIGVALLEYAERHGDGHRFPPDLDTLFDRGLLQSEAVLACPSHPPTLRTPAGRRTTYRYWPGLSLLLPTDTMVLGEPGTPHPGPQPFGQGLECSLRGLRYGSDHWIAAQQRALDRARRPAPALARELREGPPYDRTLSAWALWRKPDPATRDALRAALADRDYDVRLYAGLALFALGDTRGVPAVLRVLRVQANRGGGFAIEGPRRRWLIEQLSREKRARPVAIFPYDPVEEQRAALTRWLARWKQG